MTPVRSLALGTLFLLAACAEPVPESTSPYLAELPEGLAEVADPSQNLDQVLILPEDHCYWYAHTNAVETTYLPLRTRDGRPICTELHR